MTHARGEEETREKGKKAGLDSGRKNYFSQFLWWEVPHATSISGVGNMGI